MPCAAGELCQLLDDTTPELSCCGPCQGRLHRICGEIHNPDDDQDENRICQSCVAAKTADATSDRSKAAKRKEGGSFLQQDAPKKRKKDNRKQLTSGEKLEILKLLDQKVVRGEIARRFKCGISTVGDIKKDRATLEKYATDMLREGVNGTATEDANPSDDEPVLDDTEEAESAGGRAFALPPPFLELSSLFGPLEEHAESCGSSEAVYHLRKAMSFIAARASKPAVQTDIRSMFSG